MKRSLVIIGILLLVSTISGCGPSPEEIATQTAAAWTATPPPPTPTPTPTQVPYDLTVLITDTEGSPLSNVSVTLNELGDDESASQSTDDAGKASWMNLPGETVSFIVAHQGYFPGEGSETIERGVNEVALALERDPFGLLSADACAAGEKLLYIEDFQDEQAQDWPEIEFNAPGWTLGTLPEQEGNYGVSSAPGTFSRLEGGYVFDNAVWRLKFMIQGRLTISFNWRYANEPFELNGQEVEDSRYQIITGTEEGSELRLLQLPALNVPVARGFRFPSQNIFYTLEISTFENLTQVWLDGKLIMERMEENAIPAGTLGLEVFGAPTETGDKFAYFDDLSVCELSSPFETMFIAE